MPAHKVFPWFILSLATNLSAGCRVHVDAVCEDASYTDHTCQSFLGAGLFPEESLTTSISEKFHH